MCISLSFCNLKTRCLVTSITHKLKMQAPIFWGLHDRSKLLLWHVQRNKTTLVKIKYNITELTRNFRKILDKSIVKPGIAKNFQSPSPVKKLCFHSSSVWCTSWVRESSLKVKNSSPLSIELTYMNLCQVYY